MAKNRTAEHTDAFAGLYTAGRELDYDETLTAGNRQALKWAETLDWLADK
ncbi:hypothetical protein [Corynebacterium mastitidis]|nr:hypothetical protein [Corynebacterium mastitidis]